MRDKVKKMILTFAFFVLYGSLAFAAPASKERGSGSGKSIQEAGAEATRKSLEHARTAGYTIGLSQIAGNENDKYALRQAAETHARHMSHQLQVAKDEKTARKKDNDGKPK
ncbi:uncharacterized protein FA14DRAFT_152053 [Meira miltonrushii]|uniref:Uncharacterized protein n=1 Tax=Meira miltonrushii TaxID=1280837 RepID=A0A316VGJ0_9BASI|nr:uncharacterized protein FA14DRAFT_152053 [Meira miltonrushii]PWN36620.1 hypothetical protein FA14DRAFT_152053 [Meira miltonrushii]